MDTPKNPGEIADYLRKLAAAFDTLPDAPVPAAFSLAVNFNLHRHTDDTTTNGAVMTFADLINSAAGNPPITLDGRHYSTPTRPGRLRFEVNAFLRPSEPVITIDPNI
jgi:hypothetical protein